MRSCKLDNKTYHGINFLRGLFAVLVVAAHSFDLSVQTFSPSFVETQIGKVLSATLGLGFYWVMGFFVLSGFCIQLSVLEARSSELFEYLGPTTVG
jgi:peptidoglycan/LPS O-acetylase OafA/YrhL